MLETALTLATISTGLKLANAIKQSRKAKRELKKNAAAIQEKFRDAERRNVCKVTVFLTPEEEEALDTLVGEFLSKRMLTDAEAAAILKSRER